MKLEIEKNVPIPVRTKFPGLFEKIGALEVGDSLFVDGMGQLDFGYPRKIACKGNTKQFTTRTSEKDGVKGLRIWRLV